MELVSDVCFMCVFELGYEGRGLFSYIVLLVQV